MFKIKKSTNDGIVVLSLEGQLDALTAGKIKPVIDALMDQGTTQVIYDLARLEQIDSSGVGALVSTFKRTRAEGGDTKMACIIGQPREVFKVLGLYRYIDILDSVDTAVASFSKKTKR